MLFKNLVLQIIVTTLACPARFFLFMFLIADGCFLIEMVMVLLTNPPAARPPQSLQFLRSLFWAGYASFV